MEKGSIEESRRPDEEWNSRELQGKGEPNTTAGNQGSLSALSNAAA